MEVFIFIEKVIPKPQKSRENGIASDWDREVDNEE